MSDTDRPDKKPDQAAALREALNRGAYQHAQRLLQTLHPAEIAALLESTPSPEREFIWTLVPAEENGEVLLHVNDDVRNALIRHMDPAELVAATEHLDLDDLADLIDDLPRAVTRQLLQAMDQQERWRLETVLSYPAESAGGLMNPEVTTVRPNVTLDVVIRYLRLKAELPDQTEQLVIVDRYGHYVGTLPLQTLLISDPEKTVAEVMDTEVEPIPVDLPARKVAQRFADRDLLSAPVVSVDGLVIGRITIDDVVDVIRDEIEHSMMSQVGLNEEEDMFAPALQSFRRRTLWLGINLVTAFIASAVVGLFEATLQQVVALAVLMPIVASMGGIAGSQTQTLIIRGLAQGRLTASNAQRFINKEIILGLLNGLAWALVTALLAFVWFGRSDLALVMGLAMVVNLLLAAASGIGVPLMMRRLSIDPALAGHVVLTTVTDVAGFFAFLGLGSLLLR
ncbi:MAG: magnesium transporter [Pseudomonadota bacterium]|nr:magnesium transporter [Pseudomonadota bacterium]